MALMMPRESWSDGRLDEFEKRIDERFDRVDERFDRVDERFEWVDERFEWVDKRFDTIDKRLDHIDADIREFRRTIDYRFYTLVGIMVTGFLTLAGQNAF